MRRDDQGFTLIEVLLTIILMGIGVTALLTGLTTAAKSTRGNQDLADTRSLVYAAAEAVTAATYQGCAGSGTPSNAYAAAITGVVPPQSKTGTDKAVLATVERVFWWTGTAFSEATTDCTYDNASSSLSRLQRITVSAGPDSLTFIKRGP